MTNGIILPTPQFPADFTRVGYYDANQPCFMLEVADPAYRCVYAWVDVDGSPLRYGIACGKGGLASRFRLHNRWLIGKFKPRHRNEQAKRWATIQCAPAGMIVMACRMPTREAALELENELRRQHQATLTLDFLVQGSPVRRRRDELRELWDRHGSLRPAQMQPGNPVGDIVL